MRGHEVRLTFKRYAIGDTRQMRRRWPILGPVFS